MSLSFGNLVGLPSESRAKGEATSVRRFTLAYRLVLCRAPTEEEVDTFIAFMRDDQTKSKRVDHRSLSLRLWPRHAELYSI